MDYDEFIKILIDTPVPKSLVYKLYHDDQGLPLFYSMEDLPGNWIEIDQSVFSRSPSHVRVIDGKLVEQRWRKTSKLVPGDHGTACHVDDVMIVVDQSQPHIKWSKQSNYEQH